MRASLRSILLEMLPMMLVSRNSTIRIVEMRRSIGSSFEIVFLLILIGWMVAAIPIRSRMLTMLLPMTLPRSISVLPEAREEMETASSGAPVPKATMVRPINCLLTLKLAAVEEAPAISQSAPLIRKTNPTTKSKSCNKMSICLF